jgi:hypothetical protein
MGVSYSESNQLEVNPWIKGCASWIWEYWARGWKPYYINFMFQPLPGNVESVVQQMHRAICKGFYSRFCTEFSHHPSKPSQQGRLPMLWLFPDRPVWKHEKISIRDVKFNDNGLHFNGPLMIPPVSRFKECPIQHIHDNQRKYAVHGIDRVYIKEVTRDLDGLADYMGKTIKWHRANSDDILVLPENLKRPTGEALSPEDRAVKDLQSRHNVSEGIARQMLGPTFT